MAGNVDIVAGWHKINQYMGNTEKCKSFFYVYYETIRPPQSL